MFKKSTNNLNAQKLRLLLIASIFLLVIVASVIFVLARNVLAGYASDVQKVTDTAASSSSNLSALNSLKTKLAEDQPAVERAKNIVADSQSYAYQDQIIKDFNAFAAKSKVSISGFQFNSDAGATGTTAGGSTSGTSTPTPTAGAAAPTAVGGLKTINVSVSLVSPMAYKDIMTFVHMIEQNLTKMQLSGISMVKDASSDNVTVSSLTVEVYVR